MTVIVVVPVAALAGFVIIGLLLASRAARSARGWQTPDAAVVLIVPARNEERVLPELLASLRAQTDEDFAVCVVDDASTDRTGTLLAAEALRPGANRFTVITIGPEPVGKQRALEVAIGRTAAPIILMTDADCVLPPDWVGAVRAHFRDPRVGLAFGITRVLPDRGVAAAAQSFDHLFRSTIAVSLAGFRLPFGAYGNNLAVRRAALDKIGGYGAVPHSVTEDAALLRAVVTGTRCRVIGLAERRTVVATRPISDRRGRFRQAVRWAHGALFAPDAVTRLTYASFVGLLAVLLLAPVGALAVPLFAFLPLVPIITVGLIAAVGMALVGRPGAWLVFLLPIHAIALCFFYLAYTSRAMYDPSIEWKNIVRSNRITSSPHRTQQ